MDDKKKRLIHKEINSAIIKINDEMESLQNQKRLMQAIDFSKSVDENIWKEICRTPLKDSDTLGILVKNTFSQANNIMVNKDSVYFDLYGYKIQIPTNGQGGIEIDTSWYKIDTGAPTKIYTDVTKMMMEYFSALKKGAGWYELAKIRIPFSYSKCKLFFLWFFKVKWKKIDKEYWKEREWSELEAFQKKIFDYFEERKEMKKHIDEIMTNVMPELEKFSKIHNGFKVSSGRQKTIAEIIEFEKEKT